MIVRSHGTLARYHSGCSCPDCTYAYEFSRLESDYEDIIMHRDRVFITPRMTQQRPFPARDLVLAIGQPNASILADMIGTSRGTVSKWLRLGVCLTVYEADRYAIRAGSHPALIWGQRWYDDALV